MALLDLIKPRCLTAAVATAVGVAALPVAHPAPASGQEPPPAPFGADGPPVSRCSPPTHVAVGPLPG